MRSFMFQTSFTNLCFVMPSSLKDGESMAYVRRELNLTGGKVRFSDGRKSYLSGFQRHETKHE